MILEILEYFQFIYIYEIENVNVKTIPAEFLSGHLLTLKLKLDPS